MEESKQEIKPIMEYFSGIADPRKEINKKYLLDEVVAITVLTSVIQNGRASIPSDLWMQGGKRKGK